MTRARDERDAERSFGSQTATERPRELDTSPRAYYSSFMQRDASKPPETEACVASEPERATFQRCVSCGELIAEPVATRPEHCFVCAVHAVCACADEPDR